jgi:hypothetical protein
MIEHCPSDEGVGIRGQIIEWCAQDYHIYWRFPSGQRSALLY